MTVSLRDGGRGVGALPHRAQQAEQDGRGGPEFEDYLKCGLLEHGFLRGTYVTILNV